MKTKTNIIFTTGLLLSFLFFTQLSCKKDDNTIPNPPNHANINDSRDGQTYSTITVDSLIWFSENLNYDTPGSWEVSLKSSNNHKYGRLYSFESAKTACPEGWHLATDNEWKSLMIHLGMSPEEAGGFGFKGSDQGKRLKSTSGWLYDGNGTDEIGFGALPTGKRSGTGVFEGQGTEATWWTSTLQFDDSAYTRSLLGGRDDARHGPATFNNDGGFSVRCVKDE